MDDFKIRPSNIPAILSEVVGISGGIAYEKVVLRFKQEEKGYSVDLHLPDDCERYLGRWGRRIINEQGLTHKIFIGEISTKEQALEMAQELSKELLEKRISYYRKRGEYA
jgi:hypothetical protein